MEGKLYNIDFYLNDGENGYKVARGVWLSDILPSIEYDIRSRNPDWRWNEKISGWGDISIYKDGKTYIRLSGIGDVNKGQTHYVIWRTI